MIIDLFHFSYIFGFAIYVFIHVNLFSVIFISVIGYFFNSFTLGMLSCFLSFFCWVAEKMFVIVVP